jgi:hypothetical protein
MVKNREFVRSFQATSKKSKYITKIDTLYSTLDIKDSADAMWEEYMCVPRIVTQGQKSIDLRVDTPHFRTALLNWLACMGEDFQVEAIAKKTARPLVPGFTRKQLEHIVRHKDSLPKEYSEKISTLVKVLPESDDKLVRELKSAFL